MWGLMRIGMKRIGLPRLTVHNGTMLAIDRRVIYNRNRKPDLTGSGSPDLIRFAGNKDTGANPFIPRAISGPVAF